MAKDKASFSKLSQMRAEERARAAQRDPGLLQGLSPTELALLFPDYFKRGTPDVGGFYAAISKTTAEKQSALMQSIGQRVGVDASTGQSYPGAAGFGKVNNPVKAKEIYDYIRSKGIDHVHALGIVNNINHESSFNSGSEHWDVNGPSGGLFQHHDVAGKGGRYTKMTSFVGADWKTNWKGQIDYALTEREMKSYLSTNYGDASAASVGFTKQFENPANANSVAFDRLKSLGTLEKLSQEGGTTTAGATGGNTPKQAAGDTTKQEGQKTSGAAFNVVSGYIVPKDNSLYDTRNAQQCATLGKAFNPNIGRSSGWTVVDADIKAGQVVATKQYNNGGADRTGAGYHTGVALTAPNEKGDFLLLEQYNNSGGAKTRWVNKNSYPIGHTGQTTSWGLISSGGKVHDEISPEALSYGQSLGTPAQSAAIGSNSGGPGTGGESAPGVSGQVTEGPIGGQTFGQGDQQSASLMQPMGMVQNLMGMMQGGGPMGMMGMLGGMGGQSATPLGLITTAMGFIMPLIGSIAGERLSGEGMGDAGPRRRHHHRHTKGHTGSHSSRTGAHSPNTNIGAKPSRSVNPVNAAADPKDDYIRRTAIEREAKKLGINPHHLTTAMLYESIGSLNPNRKGVVDTRKPAKAAVAQGAQNRFMGLIQFGSAEQIKYGVKPGMSFDQHMSSVGEFLKDRGLAKWMKEHPNATEEQKKIALYSTINAGSPSEKNWHKTDKRYGGSSTTIIQKTEHMFRDWGSRASTLMAAAEPSKTNQFAKAMPTTGIVGPGVTTQPGTTLKTPENIKVATEPSFTDKAKQAIGLAPPAAAETKMPAATTPKTQASFTTPPNIPAGTPSVSSSVSAVAAPTTKFSKESRNASQIYSSFNKTDIMHQFGYGKKMSADVVPETNVPVAPAAPFTTQSTVVPQRASQAAPGPAPDATAMQMSQMRTEMAAFSATQGQTTTSKQQDISLKSVDLDRTMKDISQPYDNPSFHRAMSRAYGNETPGEVGQNHFSYGNAR